MVTASAALENGYGLDSVWPNPHELDLPLTDGTIQNFGGETCPGGATTTLLTAFTNSCNVIFGEIGLKLEADALSAQAHAYGFCPTDPPEETECLEPTIPFTIPFATGRFPIPSYFEGNDPLVAISAIGQDNDLANPLQMALVASAIANRGVMMTPKSGDARSGTRRGASSGSSPEEYGQPISEKTATAMREMMVNVVASGTGTAGADPRLRGRGQDRHRAARRTRLGPPRVVRVLRARGTGRGPDDRGRGYRLGRRRPRERGDRGPGGRADRPAGPRGVPGGLGRGVR